MWPVAVLSELRRLLACGVVLGFVLVIPPLYRPRPALRARRSPSVLCLAMVVPALVVLGAPRAFTAQNLAGADFGRSSRSLPNGWRRNGSATRPFADAGPRAIHGRRHCLADSRRRAAVERDPLLVPVEAVSLLVVGVAFWLELVESGRLRPRVAPAFARGDGRRGHVGRVDGRLSSGLFQHLLVLGFPPPGRAGLKCRRRPAILDRSLWLVAAVSFMPVVFWNMLAWLRSEDDIDIGLERSALGPKSRLGLLGPQPAGWGKAGMSGSGKCVPRISSATETSARQAALSEARPRSRATSSWAIPACGGW